MQGGEAAMEQVLSAQRRAMVDGQIRTFDVTDQRVIRAFDLTRRELFLPQDLHGLAYSDALLPLRSSDDPTFVRTLLQPMHLARMLQGAAPAPDDHVLVVAGEAGYAAALLLELAASVVSLEADASLTARAAAHAAQAAPGRMTAVTGELASGWAASGPYSLILVQGAIETNLDKLFKQLAPGGRLVAIETSLPHLGRRTGRVMLFQPVHGEISGRALFDATVPVLAEFRSAPAFVF